MTSTRFSSPALRSSTRTRRVDASTPPWRSRPPRCCSSPRPFSWGAAFWWLRCWVARLQPSATTPWRCGPLACHATTLVWRPGSLMSFRLWWQCRYFSGWRFCFRFGSRSDSADGSTPAWATTWIGPSSGPASSSSSPRPSSRVFSSVEARRANVLRADVPWPHQEPSVGRHLWPSGWARRWPLNRGGAVGVSRSCRPCWQRRSPWPVWSPACASTAASRAHWRIRNWRASPGTPASRRHPRPRLGAM